MSSPATAPRFHLESLRWVRGEDHDLIASGWAFLPGRSGPLRLFSRVRGHLDEPSWRERPDVSAAFPDDPSALHSGFTVAISRCRPGDTIEFVHRSDANAESVIARVPAATAQGARSLVTAYGDWLDRDQADSAARAGSLLAAETANQVRFSILTPVCDPEPGQLRAAAASVKAQLHPGWEWCIHDDGSQDPRIHELLAEISRDDPRVRVSHGARSGNISRATNRALENASHEFALFLDHDDALHPHALREIARLLGNDPTLDVLYTDEDKLDERGSRIEPAFKPDFSPIHLLGVMYVGHLLCARTSLLRELGGTDPRFHGVQDYELMLRLSEKARRITHVRRVLYHWRRHPQSVASSITAKANLDALQVEAVDAALRRRALPGRARALGELRVGIAMPDTHLPSLTVFADGDVGAIDYPRLRSICRTDLNRPWSEVWKLVEKADADAVLFLPQGVHVHRENAWAALGAACAQPGILAAGPVLLRGAGNVAAAGLAWHEGRLVACHPGASFPSDGYRGSLRVNRECSAVPLAGLMLKKNALGDLRGLLETRADAAIPWMLACSAACAGRVVVVPECTLMVPDWREPECPARAEDSLGKFPGSDPYFAAEFID